MSKVMSIFMGQSNPRPKETMYKLHTYNPLHDSWGRDEYNSRKPELHSEIEKKVYDASKELYNILLEDIDQSKQILEVSMTYKIVDVKIEK